VVLGIRAAFYSLIFRREFGHRVDVWISRSRQDFGDSSRKMAILVLGGIR